MNDLEVTVHKDVLIVKGSKQHTETTEEYYIHKGLSGKSFERTFKLGEYIRLKEAKLEHGLLVLFLQEEVPEENLPIKIKIN